MLGKLLNSRKMAGLQKSNKNYPTTFQDVMKYLLFKIA